MVEEAEEEGDGHEKRRAEEAVADNLCPGDHHCCCLDALVLGVVEEALHEVVFDRMDHFLSCLSPGLVPSPGRPWEDLEVHAPFDLVRQIVRPFVHLESLSVAAVVDHIYPFDPSLEDLVYLLAQAHSENDLLLLFLALAPPPMVVEVLFRRVQEVAFHLGQVPSCFRDTSLVTKDTTSWSVKMKIGEK